MLLNRRFNHHRFWFWISVECAIDNKWNAQLPKKCMSLKCDDIVYVIVYEIYIFWWLNLNCMRLKIELEEIKIDCLRRKDEKWSNRTWGWWRIKRIARRTERWKKSLGASAKAKQGPRQERNKERARAARRIFINMQRYRRTFVSDLRTGHDGEVDEALFLQAHRPRRTYARSPG